MKPAIPTTAPPPQSLRDSLVERLADVMRRVWAEDRMPATLRSPAAMFDAIRVFVDVADFNASHPGERIAPVARPA